MRKSKFDVLPSKHPRAVLRKRYSLSEYCFLFCSKIMVQDNPGIWETTISCFLSQSAWISGYFIWCLMVHSVIAIILRSQTGILYQTGKYLKKILAVFFFNLGCSWNDFFFIQWSRVTVISTSLLELCFICFFANSEKKTFSRELSWKAGWCYSRTKRQCGKAGPGQVT